MCFNRLSGVPLQSHVPLKGDLAPAAVSLVCGSSTFPGPELGRTQLDWAGPGRAGSGCEGTNTRDWKRGLKKSCRGSFEGRDAQTWAAARRVRSGLLPPDTGSGASPGVGG